jgi:hypothetical protein
MGQTAEPAETSYKQACSGFTCGSRTVISLPLTSAQPLLRDPHHPNKEQVMIRFVLSALIIGSFAMALVGCHAEGDIHGSTNVVVPQ